jgi:hypothetical protein
MAGRAAALVCGAVILAGCIGPGSTSEVTPSGRANTFPAVTGLNLAGVEVRLPDGFEGDRNLVAVAFRREQQAAVDTWIEAAGPLVDAHPGLRFYELPTIDERGALFRFYVNNGMRAGIPDPDARARTITLYLDKTAFRRALDMADEEAIYVLLLDARGRELWRARGPATPEAVDTLRRRVAGRAAGIGNQDQ